MGVWVCELRVCVCRMGSGWVGGWVGQVNSGWVGGRAGARRDAGREEAWSAAARGGTKRGAQRGASALVGQESPRWGAGGGLPALRGFGPASLTRSRSSWSPGLCPPAHCPPASPPARRTCCCLLRGLKTRQSMPWVPFSICSGARAQGAFCPESPAKSARGPPRGGRSPPRPRAAPPGNVGGSQSLFSALPSACRGFCMQQRTPC